MIGYRLRPFLLLLALFCARTVATGESELCSDDAVTFAVKLGDSKNLFRRSVPKLAESAGQFYKRPAAKSIADCIAACCAAADCNVAFLYNGSNCYSIDCFNLTSCEPVDSAAAKHQNSSFVWVRTPRDASSTTGPTPPTERLDGDISPTPSTSPATPPPPPDAYGVECDAAQTTQQPCPPPLVCASAVDDARTLCICPSGYVHVSDDAAADAPCRLLAAESGAAPPRACEQGIDTCPPREICNASSHARRGWCVCPPGERRDEHGGCALPSSTPASSTPPPPLPLEVGLVGPPLVQLPANEAVLNASVFEGDEKADYAFAWRLVSPEELQPSATAWNKPELHLSNLVAGSYVFEVAVTLGERKGVKQFSLKVLPEVLPNKWPQAVITPSKMLTTENSQILLDGTSSKDEDGVIKAYEWREISGPAIKDMPPTNQATMKFESLSPGNYSFSLTVTDNQQAKSNASVFVVVKAERDDKPVAKAGVCGGELGGFSVQLPVREILICGNASYDDKGPIAAYKWARTDTNKETTTDMEGTANSVLRLTKAMVGSYAFALTVTDSNDQTDTDTININVRAQANQAPVANAGPNSTVDLPLDSAVLDGGLTSDDGPAESLSYQWAQVRGPSDAVLTNADHVKATATKLVEGLYDFRLNVTDAQGLSSVSHTFITVRKSKNDPPRAVASNVTALATDSLAVLNASKSTDDAGVVRWLWQLRDDSPAVIKMLGDSANRPVLLLSDFGFGVYTFNLTVWDQLGAPNSLLVRLTVNKGAEFEQSVEMYLDVKFDQLTVLKRDRLRRQMEAALDGRVDTSEKAVVTIFDVSEDPTSGRVRLLWYAKTGDEGKVVRAADALNAVRHSADLRDLRIRSVDARFCTNTCSGHGRCDHFSKRCLCDAYWMRNVIAFYVFGQADSCGWSVLYVTLVSLLLLLVAAAGAWSLLSPRLLKQQTKRRWRRLGARQRNRALDLKHNGVKQRQPPTSLLISTDSASDSDQEDTLFDSSPAATRNGSIAAAAPTTT